MSCILLREFLGVYTDKTTKIIYEVKILRQLKSERARIVRTTVRFLTCLLPHESQLWNKWTSCSATTASKRPRSPTLGPPFRPVHRPVPATSSFHAMEMGTWWVTIIVIISSVNTLCRLHAPAPVQENNPLITDTIHFLRHFCRPKAEYSRHTNVQISLWFHLVIPG
jgi:hypothetical protein